MFETLNQIRTKLNIITFYDGDIKIDDNIIIDIFNGNFNEDELDMTNSCIVLLVARYYGLEDSKNNEKYLEFLNLAVSMGNKLAQSVVLHNFMNENNIDRAIEYIESVKNMDNHTLPWLINCGYTYNKNKEYEKSSECYSKAYNMIDSDLELNNIQSERKIIINGVLIENYSKIKDFENLLICLHRESKLNYLQLTIANLLLNNLEDVEIYYSHYLNETGIEYHDILRDILIIEISNYGTVNDIKLKQYCLHNDILEKYYNYIEMFTFNNYETAGLILKDILR